ncbi:MAG: hypothetical protein K9G67_03820 [Bacteroidales bacterium]|nr:hypothetical protein [Bacteroidales bacterium]MCF8343926.1 hypothetical protein [Bacteroidales bacterium]MCF8349941.1 hypothetical protein [Bacteroidales bacterium]MCF8375458.1 hypothetical protein [Bacteroidales bacterium]MCF8401338.1 hypothetical protein [Bacteroidales bacterium]
MYQKKQTIIFLSIAFLLVTKLALAGWQIDNEFNFKINVPDNWSKQTYFEGIDKVHDFSNPEGNMAIQIRCFAADAGVNSSILAEVFDENLLNQGASRLSKTDETLNGIPGVMGVYKNIFDGIEMAIVTFSTVPGDEDYLNFAIVPLQQFEQLAQEVDKVLNTFTLLSAPEFTEEPQKEETGIATGLSGLQGSTSGSSTGKNYFSISGPTLNGTFYFEESGSYPIKVNGNVVIRGLDKSGTNALELYLYNNRGTRTFSHEAATGGDPRFIIGDGKSVGNDNYSGSGRLTVTEYREDGLIKGHFTANTNGHDVEGCFYLSLSTPKGFGGY